MNKFIWNYNKFRFVFYNELKFKTLQFGITYCWNVGNKSLIISLFIISLEFVLVNRKNK